MICPFFVKPLRSVPGEATRRASGPHIDSTIGSKGWCEVYKLVAEVLVDLATDTKQETEGALGAQGDMMNRKRGW